jgi:hypothetical protein
MIRFFAGLNLILVFAKIPLIIKELGNLKGWESSFIVNATYLPLLKTLKKSLGKILVCIRLKYL